MERRILLKAAAAWLAGGSAAMARPRAEPEERLDLDEARFWAIIDRTAVHEANRSQQTAALHRELSALSVEEVVAFAHATERQLARACRWDLWAVGYIIEGGMSDDGFEYFRRWLLSKGRSTFERILAAPDDLADMLPRGATGELEYEDFTYVAWEVWGEKTGANPSDIPMPPDFILSGPEPAGQPFQEDAAWLAGHFPKTWARFGA
jgi:hypothetical protein